MFDIEPIALLQHPQSVNAIACNQKWLLTASSDGLVRKFDLVPTVNGKSKLTQAQQVGLPPSLWRAGVSLGSFQQPSAVLSLVMQRQSLWALSGLQDGSINLNTLRHDSGTLMHTLKQHVAPVSCLMLNKTENEVVSASWDQQIICWDLDNGSIKRQFQSVDSRVTSLSASPANDQTFLASTQGGNHYIFDHRQDLPLIQFRTQDISWCMNSVWSMDGGTFLAGRRDEAVDIWNVRAGKVQEMLKLPVNSGQVTALLPLDDRFIIIGSNDGIRLWDLDATKIRSTPFRTLGGHYGGMLSQLLKQDNFILLASGNRGFDGVQETHQCTIYDRGSQLFESPPNSLDGDAEEAQDDFIMQE